MLNVFLTVLSVILATHARATPDFAAALTNMDQGDFEAAAKIYEMAVNEGARNGHLFYNLGICYQRLKRPGDAIAAFLAARRYLPRDPDVGANLRFVVAKIPDKLETELALTTWARLTVWVDRFSVKELAYATAVGFGLCGVVLSLSLSLERLQHFRRSAAVLVLLPLLLAATTGGRALRDHPWGAVTKPEVKVLSGPGTANTAIFQLREGAPFAIVNSQVANYWQIELSDGKKGWIARADARAFAVP